MKQNLAFELTESGYVPDAIVRHGIRSLLKQRLDEIDVNDVEATSREQMEFIKMMNNSPVALLTDKANEQHYEVPAEFYQHVLGPAGKYSCCYWPQGVTSLAEAEVAALEQTCDRAQIRDGMDILELGCGWGSLTLWLARHYSACQITAVSNSSSQAKYIQQRAYENGYDNIRVITADMNDFEIDDSFDRVVSVEMFEHMRNYQEMFRRIRGWLRPDGKFFMHIFAHRSTPYTFEEKDSSDWMTRFFFSGGIMPSDDLPLCFQQDLVLQQRWRWSGEHYQQTAEAWLKNLDLQRDEVWPVLQNTYGKDFTKIWFMRWRMFFLAVSELFGYDGGKEWFVSHYLFETR